MTVYYLASLMILLLGGMILGFIYKNYPKNRTRNILFWAVIILTIMSSLAIILEKFNICLILFGIIECMYTYKYNKKYNYKPSLYNLHLINGYILGAILILVGIGKGFTNGFLW